MPSSKMLIALCSLPALALCAVKRATSGTFGLYGYSDRFGGIPFFYADGTNYGCNIDSLSHLSQALGTLVM